MSESSNEEAKAAMREKNSTNLNTSGREGVTVAKYFGCEERAA
jgi:hypothetical protein